MFVHKRACVAVLVWILCVLSLVACGGKSGRSDQNTVHNQEQAKSGVVPDVVGFSQIEARTKVEAAGFVVGDISQSSSASVPEGHILSQIPAAGMTVLLNSRIALVVSSGPQTVVVPDVIGLQQAAAESEISAAALLIGAITTASSSTVPIGFVITQLPQAGSSVASGSSVSITVSSGPEKISVPDVRGQTQSLATTAIVSTGLMLGSIARQSSSSVPVGTVISQLPIAGSLVAKGSTVDLIVSSGPAITSSFISLTTKMISPRIGHTATLMADGLVLIAGGSIEGGAANPFDEAELYDPSTKRFESLSNRMVVKRLSPSSVLLPDGKVLIMGGQNDQFIVEKSAEVYDPATRMFSLLGPQMTVQRSAHAAVRLTDNRILITGGTGSGATAEIYDPSHNTFTALAAPMVSRRTLHTATLLPNNEVLITGGWIITSGTCCVTTNTAEIFNPKTSTFRPANGNMSSPRAFHSAAKLPDGRVLLTGGIDAAGMQLNTAEVYDSNTGTFTTISAKMLSTRNDHTSTLLNDGTVILLGGVTPSPGTAEVFESSTAMFRSNTPILTMPRAEHAMSALTSGKVLVTGGSNGSAVQRTTEIYDPSQGQFIPGPLMGTARLGHSSTLLSSGKVLIAGGANLDTTELYEPITGTMAPSARLTTARGFHTATLLDDGQVLITGGWDGTNYLNTAELFDPITGKFTLLASTMNFVRGYHAAARLLNGVILITGGADGKSSTAHDTAEIYDPVAKKFLLLSTKLTGPRYGHAMTPIAGNNALLMGGYDANFNSDSAEIYDANSGVFGSIFSTMTSARYRHSACLLPDGRVLITGGWGITPGAQDTVEIYVP